MKVNTVKVDTAAAIPIPAAPPSPAPARLSRAKTVAVKSLALLFISLTLGCTAVTGKIKPLSSDVIAVLPVKIDRRMSADYQRRLSEQIETALRNRGYTTIDPRIVASKCKKRRCPELFSQYGSRAVVEMALHSFRRVNAVLGYVNRVAGTLRLFDQHGAVIGMVSATESEHGGLLFNSGQIVRVVSGIVKPLIAKAGENDHESTFSRLVDKLVRRLVLQMPHSKDRDRTKNGKNATVPHNQVSDNSAVANSTSSNSEDKISPRTYSPVIEKLNKPVVFSHEGRKQVTFCLQGSEGMFARIFVNGSFATMFERPKGVYCRSVAEGALKAVAPSAFVELTSSLGVRTREPLNTSGYTICDPHKAITLSEQRDKVLIDRKVSGCSEATFTFFISATNSDVPRIYEQNLKTTELALPEGKISAVLVQSSNAIGIKSGIRNIFSGDSK